MTRAGRLYSESLGHELGLFTDPMQYYGRLSDEMLRAMRLVVDTGLHAKGWSREQAIRLHARQQLARRHDIESEVERYIVYPGQALGYKIGDLRDPGTASQGGSGARHAISTSANSTRRCSRTARCRWTCSRPRSPLDRRGERLAGGPAKPALRPRAKRA